MDTISQINNCAVILLAAGSSKRLGQPKQLLTYQGKSFLENMVSAAVDSRLSPILVVLGANAGLIRPGVNEDEVKVVVNSDWEEGIASSIRCGITALQKINPVSDAAILMVCDQPYLTSSLLNDLVSLQKKTGKPIVAAEYEGVRGTPVLFHKTFFHELLLLKGDRGAGKILQQRPDLVAAVLFSLGAIDIDTMDSYKKLDRGH